MLDITREEFGQMLRRARRGRHLSLRDAAAMIGNVTPSTLCEWENGGCVAVEKISAALEAYGMTLTVRAVRERGR